MARGDRPRKPKGASSAKVALPIGVSAHDAWIQLGAIPGESPTYLAMREEEDRPRKASGRRRAESLPCTCRCQCGNSGTGGLCYLCNQDLHHRCSRMCGELPPANYGRGLSTGYLPRRQACDGGGPLGVGKWIPKHQTEMPEAVKHRATS